MKFHNIFGMRRCLNNSLRYNCCMLNYFRRFDNQPIWRKPQCHYHRLIFHELKRYRRYITCTNVCSIGTRRIRLNIVHISWLSNFQNSPQDIMISINLNGQKAFRNRVCSNRDPCLHRCTCDNFLNNVECIDYSNSLDYRLISRILLDILYKIDWMALCITDNIMSMWRSPLQKWEILRLSISCKFKDFPPNKWHISDCSPRQHKSLPLC